MYLPRSKCCCFPTLNEKEMCEIKQFYFVVHLLWLGLRSHLASTSCRSNDYLEMSWRYCDLHENLSKNKEWFGSSTIFSTICGNNSMLSWVLPPWRYKTWAKTSWYSWKAVMKGLSIAVKFIGKLIQRPNSKCDEIKIQMNKAIILTTTPK